MLSVFLLISQHSSVILRISAWWCFVSLCCSTYHQSMALWRTDLVRVKQTRHVLLQQRRWMYAVAYVIVIYENIIILQNAWNYFTKIFYHQNPYLMLALLQLFFLRFFQTLETFHFRLQAPPSTKSSQLPFNSSCLQHDATKPVLTEVFTKLANALMHKLTEMVPPSYDPAPSHDPAPLVWFDCCYILTVI